MAEVRNVKLKLPSPRGELLVTEGSLDDVELLADDCRHLFRPGHAQPSDAWHAYWLGPTLGALVKLRPAERGVVEWTICVNPPGRGTEAHRGIGSTVLEHIKGELVSRETWVIRARITADNADSLRFHQRRGFEWQRDDIYELRLI